MIAYGGVVAHQIPLKTGESSDRARFMENRRALHLFSKTMVGSLPQEPLTRDIPRRDYGSAGRRRLHELRRKLLHQGGRECIGNHIDVVLYHRPHLFLAGVILVLKLVDLSDMMVDMSSK